MSRVLDNDDKIPDYIMMVDMKDDMKQEKVRVENVTIVVALVFRFQDTLIYRDFTLWKKRSFIGFNFNNCEYHLKYCFLEFELEADFSIRFDCMYSRAGRSASSHYWYHQQIPKVVRGFFINCCFLTHSYSGF